MITSLSRHAKKSKFLLGRYSRNYTYLEDTQKLDAVNILPDARKEPAKKSHSDTRAYKSAVDEELSKRIDRDVKQVDKQTSQESTVLATTALKGLMDISSIPRVFYAQPMIVVLISSINL